MKTTVSHNSTPPKPPRLKGYYWLAGPYHATKEKAMLNATLADMERGNIDHQKITESDGTISVYRTCKGRLVGNQDRKN